MLYLDTSLLVAAPGVYAALAEKKAVELPFPVESPTLEGYLYPETYRVDADPFDVKNLTALRALRATSRPTRSGISPARP